MQYSNYLAELMRFNGFPNLSLSSIQDYFNIISLEGQIRTYSKIRKTLDTNEQFKYDLEVFKLNKEVTRITGNLKPEEFVKLLIEREH